MNDDLELELERVTPEIVTIRDRTDQRKEVKFVKVRSDYLAKLDQIQLHHQHDNLETTLRMLIDQGIGSI